MTNSDLSRTSVCCQKTALVVDGRDNERETLRDFLAQADYNVLTTSNSGQAVEICRSYSGAIDLLVTDIDLPGTSGFDLASAATRIRPGLVVMFLPPEVLPVPPQGQLSAGVDTTMLLDIAKALAKRSEHVLRRN